VKAVKWMDRRCLIIIACLGFTVLLGCLLLLAFTQASTSFFNAKVIGTGGYLYDDNGSIIGMWDGLVPANYPILYLPFYAISYLFWGTSVLWKMMVIVGTGLVWYLARIIGADAEGIG